MCQACAHRRARLINVQMPWESWPHSNMSILFGVMPKFPSVHFSLQVSRVGMLGYHTRIDLKNGMSQCGLGYGLGPKAFGALHQPETALALFWPETTKIVMTSSRFSTEHWLLNAGLRFEVGFSCMGIPGTGHRLQVALVSSLLRPRLQILQWRMKLITTNAGFISVAYRVLIPATTHLLGLAVRHDCLCLQKLLPLLQCLPM